MAAILKTIFIWFLEWGVGKLAPLIKKALKYFKFDKKVDQTTKDQAETLKNSQTDDEDEKAAQDILSGR